MGSERIRNLSNVIRKMTGNSFSNICLSHIWRLYYFGETQPNKAVNQSKAIRFLKVNRFIKSPYIIMANWSVSQYSVLKIWSYHQVQRQKWKDYKRISFPYKQNSRSLIHQLQFNTHTIHFYSQQKPKNHPKMNNCIPQSQPVETSMEEDEFSTLSIVYKTEPPSQSTRDQDPAFAKLTAFMRNASEPDFEDSLKLMNEHFAKGQASLFLEETEIQKRLMNSFVRLSRELQKNSQAESKMLFILSLIAEMIKESPHFNFPFTRKFLLTVFEIDNESLQQASYKNQIMAILSVIYSNISSQFRLIKKLNVEKELKNALMTNYYLINQLFTLKLFNQSILNLASKGVAFTSADFAKHAILDTISKFIAKNQVETFLTRMKTCMFKPKHNPASDLKQNPKKLLL